MEIDLVSCYKRIVINLQKCLRNFLNRSFYFSIVILLGHLSQMILQNLKHILLPNYIYSRYF